MPLSWSLSCLFQNYYSNACHAFRLWGYKWQIHSLYSINLLVGVAWNVWQKCTASHELLSVSLLNVLGCSTSQELCLRGYLSCCVSLWNVTNLFYPYPPGLLHWFWGNQWRNPNECEWMHRMNPEEFKMQPEWQNATKSSAYVLANSVMNSLAPGRFKFKFRCVIFKPFLVNGGWGISYEIALRWMSQGLTDDKSTLVQVTSHYLSQCWPRSVSPNGVTRPQWVNSRSNPIASLGCYIGGIITMGSLP